MKTALPIIKLLSTAYEICPDTKVTASLVCPICNMCFNLDAEFALREYASHFAANWDTHKPDFLMDGVPVQIVRRV